MIKSINRAEISNIIHFLYSRFISTSTSIMRFLIQCTLVVIVIMAHFGYIHSATCLCYCCSGIGCTATSTGNISVTSCSSCASSLCQSTYSSTCVSVNGVTSSSCSAGSDAPTLFKPIYATLATVMMSFSILIYRQIKW